MLIIYKVAILEEYRFQIKPKKKKKNEKDTARTFAYQ